MLDLKFIRDNTDLVRRALANRKSSAPLEEILQLDGERRKKIIELEDLRHNRKEAAKDRTKDRASAEEGRDLRKMIKGLEDEVKHEAALLKARELGLPEGDTSTLEADR